MKIIRKKAWPELFEAVLEGKKKFDLRLGDIDLMVGDILILEEFDPKVQKYSGRKLKKKISFVLKTKENKFWSKKETDKYGFIIASFD